MHIIQLTDIHVSEANEKPYGVDVRGNFIAALDAIRKLMPDLLVISGDLCYDTGQPEIYEWIKRQLDDLPFPYRLIPGNHDDTGMMIDCFDLKSTTRSGQLFYTITDSPQPLIFLDTSSYTLPRQQLQWLEIQLKAIKKPACLFMHHPPAKMGVPYMDQNHGLGNMQEVMAVLLAHSYPISIFTGHYHADKSMRKQNLDIHITPSTFFQIDWTKTAFQLDHTRCGFRSIQLNEKDTVHAVIYF